MAIKIARALIFLFTVLSSSFVVVADEQQEQESSFLRGLNSCSTTNALKFKVKTLIEPHLLEACNNDELVEIGEAIDFRISEVFSDENVILSSTTDMCTYPYFPQRRRAAQNEDEILMAMTADQDYQEKEEEEAFFLDNRELWENVYDKFVFRGTNLLTFASVFGFLVSDVSIQIPYYLPLFNLCYIRERLLSILRR